MSEALSRVRRYAQVVAIGSKHDFGWFFDQIGLGSLLQSKDDAARKNGDRYTYAERVRMVLQELGPTFVKAGQILSTRPDLIPRDFIVELKKLQDDVAPFPFEQVKETVEKELREVFRTLSGGDASLAQQSEVLMEFLLKEKLYYQPDLILLDKTFGTLEETIRTLCPDLDIAALFEEVAPELGKTLLSPKEMAQELLGRLLHMDDVLIDTPPLVHRVLSRLDAGKLTLKVERSLGARGVGELAGLLLATSFCALGLVLLAGAMALHDVASGSLLFGQPLWPTLLAIGGALGFGVGVVTLLRLRGS